MAKYAPVPPTDRQRPVTPMQPGISAWTRAIVVIAAGAVVAAAMLLLARHFYERQDLAQWETTSDDENNAPVIVIDQDGVRYEGVVYTIDKDRHSRRLRRSDGEKTDTAYGFLGIPYSRPITTLAERFDPPNKLSAEAR